MYINSNLRVRRRTKRERERKIASARMNDRSSNCTKGKQQLFFFVLETLVMYKLYPT